MSKLVLNVNYLLLLSFLSAAEFYNLDHNQIHKICPVHVIWTGHRMSKLVLKVKYLLLLIFFKCGQVLQFGAHSRYYNGALTQKRSFLGICTTFRYDLSKKS